MLARRVQFSCFDHWMRQGGESRQKLADEDDGQEIVRRQLWRGCQQRLGVFRLRMFADLLPATLLNNAALAHDENSIRHVARERHGVGDEDVREMQLALQFSQQVGDLRGHADIEGGGRLIEDEKLGTQNQSAGKVDALALTAGKFVGIAGKRRIIETRHGESFDNLGAPGFFRGESRRGQSCGDR